jgi:hypothetical protein
MHKIDNSDKRREYGKQVKHAASLNKPMDSRKAERYFRDMPGTKQAKSEIGSSGISLETTQ